MELVCQPTNNIDPFNKVIKYFEKNGFVFILSSQYLSIKFNDNYIESFKLHKTISDIILNDKDEYFSCSSR